MFKIILYTAAIITVSWAAPIDNNKITDSVKLLSYNNEPINEDLQYRFDFKQSDGQEREEDGIFYGIGDSGELQFVVHGSYQYIGPDNVLYTVTYTADDKGFHPEGDHLPGYVPTTDEPVQLSQNAVLSLIG